jgi:hypothetical protein
MYRTIGQNSPDYLLADPQGADVIAIPMEPNNGTVKRGTVVYRKSNGMYAPAASANVASTNYLAVLDEEVNTNANLVVAEDARAYRAGRLIAGKVKLASDADLTAAHIAVLRLQGLVLNQMTDTAPGFDNYKIVITYKANGGTGNDVVAYADAGSSYTIAANTFTAPTGKSFSKWNTKAAGTGTDYAAAATYTADADLTLYAIWADA